MQPGNPREPGFYSRSLETPGEVNASTAFFYLIYKNDDCLRARVLRNDADA